MVSSLLISAEMGLQIVREKQFHDEQKNCYFKYDYFPQGFARPHGSEAVNVKRPQVDKVLPHKLISVLCNWIN
jgi:hypothetical protein